MKRIFTLALAAGSLASAPAVAEECTHMWDLSQDDTDPTHRKGLSGDANAAYPVFSFRGNPNTRYVIKGHFPHARFMSFETVWGQKDFKVDALFDREIVPDAGSVNPFVDGADMGVATRDYTIEAVPEGYDRPNARNLMKLPSNRLLHSFMMRIYAPNDGLMVATADIPRVFAYEAGSERPTACPRALYSDPYFHFPQVLTRVFSRTESFEFKAADVAWGPNSAIPKYLYGVDRMRTGSEVAVVRLKAPQHAETQAGAGPFPGGTEVRYWSLCVQNFAKNETLGCLPDHLAVPDAEGMVTAVVGRGAAVKAAAEANGHAFIEDLREPNQVTVEFAYRNIFPSADFQANAMYQGEYLPRGVLCAREGYVAGDCGH